MFKKFSGKSLHQYWHLFHTVLLFNFIEQRPHGVTYYDIQQIENVPASRTYRFMKKLEEEGFLERKEEQNDMGRPKYVFFITPQGFKQKELLKQRLKSILELLQTTFPTDMEFDIQLFLEKGTIAMFETPFEHIKKSNCEIDKKLELLESMREDHEDRLKKINTIIKDLKLQKKEEITK